MHHLQQLQQHFDLWHPEVKMRAKFHLPKKEQQMHESFQLRRARFLNDLDNQTIPRVGEVFQSHLRGQSKSCGRMIDVQYQTKLHLSEIRKFGVSRYSIQQHQDLVLDDHRSCSLS